MIFGFSSSSPYQSSPIPTHYYRDLGNWNHHHWDHQAPGRGALRNSLGVLHPKNHLPARSAWDSQRSVKVMLLTSAPLIMHAKSFGFHLFSHNKSINTFFSVWLPSQRPTPLREKDCVPVPCVQRSKNPPSKPARWWSRHGCLRRSWTCGRSEPSRKGQMVPDMSRYARSLRKTY